MIKSHLNLCQCGSLERRHFRRCGIGAAMLALVFQVGCSDTSPPPQPLAKVKVTTAAVTGKLRSD